MYNCYGRYWSSHTLGPSRKKEYARLTPIAKKVAVVVIDDLPNNAIEFETTQEAGIP